MKKFFKNTADKIKSAFKKATVVCGIGFAALAAENAHALLTSVSLQIYPLTNSVYQNATFTNPPSLLSITNGAMIIGQGGTSNVLCAPFQLWRDRGFTLNLGAYVTNNTQTNLVNAVVRYGSVHPANGLSGGSLVTNWSQYVQYTFLVNSTTETNWSVLVPRTTYDNMSLAQLYSVFNQATNALYLDPTNCYAGVYP